MFKLKLTYIMGIINATNDSFSSEGILNKPIINVVKQAIQFEKDGDDINRYRR